jgi:hypothetical protein
MMPGRLVLQDDAGRVLLDIGAWHLLAIMRYHCMIGPHVPHLPHLKNFVLLIDGQEVERPPSYAEDDEDDE